MILGEDLDRSDPVGHAGGSGALAGRPRRATAGNLPSELTSFVGRRRELAEVRRLLGTARLVTLTGPGGVGKTRLALRAGAGLARTLPHGTWLVELSPLQDPGLVAETVADTLGLRDRSSRMPVPALIEHLAERRLLLILDSCEHLLAGCHEIAETLLKACPGLLVLATSREPLGIMGEVRLPVPALSLPDPGQPGSPARLLHSESGALFAERAAATAPGFTITAGNSQAVSGLCRRMEGIPLAIELVTSWLDAFTPEQLLERVDDQLLSMTGMTSDPRHRSLQAAIGWSHALLTEPERILWRRLSVFAGSFDLVAAEAVCSGNGLAPGSVLGLLGSLIVKSVVIRDQSGRRPRYRLLNLVRRFGIEQLRAAGEETALRERHCEAVLRLAQQAGEQQWGPEQSAWLDRLELEHANIRAALEHCLAVPGAAGHGLAIGASLFLFWSTRAVGEGRRWLGLLLDADTGATPARARALAVSGALAVTQNDSHTGRPLLEKALELGRRFENTEVVLLSLRYLTISAVYDDDLPTAREHAERGLRLARTSGSQTEIAHLSTAVGGAAALADDHDRAEPMLAQGARLSRELGERWNLAYSLWLWGFSRWRRGRFNEAEELLREALELARASNDPIGASLMAETLAWVTASTQGPGRAARLLGAAEASRGALSFDLFPSWRRYHERCESQVRAQLGTAAFDAAMTRGAAMSPERALAGGAQDRRPSAAPSQRAREIFPLTQRQWQIARLVAAGRSNKEIGLQLFIDSRTVESHVYNILNKLGLNSRAQIAAWVTERSPAREA